MSQQLLAGELGVYDKSPQVRTDPNTGYQIPGVQGKLYQRGAETPGGENQEIRDEAGKSCNHTGLSSGPLPPDREDECGHTGHTNGSSVLQEPPDRSPRGPTGGSELLLHDPEVVPKLAVRAISDSTTRSARFLRELRNCSWQKG